jgi:hypothetical protein
MNKKNPDPLKENQILFLRSKMVDMRIKNLRGLSDQIVATYKLHGDNEDPYKTVQRLFNGKRVKIDIRLKVCKVLGISIYDLNSVNAPQQSAIPNADPESPIPNAHSDEVLPVYLPHHTEQRQAESPNASNLVIAAHWHGTTPDEKLRVYSKICCLSNPKNFETLHSEQDINEGIYIKNFPIFLAEKIRRSEEELQRKYGYPSGWDAPIIRLFVPMELMGLPLETWMDSRLTPYSLIIGCADRYEASRQREYQDWQKNLENSWQRFRTHAPNALTLNNLRWETADPEDNSALETCSAFRCKGQYLKHGEEYVKKWMALIEKGIPLALWGCEWQTVNQGISAFDHLTAYNRFQFLEEIHRLRQQGCDLGHQPFGVFYEDLIYTPLSPKKLRPNKKPVNP